MIFDIIIRVEKEDVIRELREKKSFQAKEKYFFKKEDETETRGRPLF